MLKKTIAASGILAAAATGAVIASHPASAQTLSWGGGCCGSSHSNFFHGSRARNRNWSGNENEGFNHIRLHINNKNNNIAIARSKNREHERNKWEFKNDDYVGGQPATGSGLLGAPSNIGAPV